MKFLNETLYKGFILALYCNIVFSLLKPERFIQLFAVLGMLFIFGLIYRGVATVVNKLKEAKEKKHDE